MRIFVEDASSRLYVILQAYPYETTRDRLTFIAEQDQ
jgi:hypothetical protein